MAEVRFGFEQWRHSFQVRHFNHGLNQPYPPLSAVAGEVSTSGDNRVDPLVELGWPKSAVLNLEEYTVDRAEKVHAVPVDAFSGTHSLVRGSPKVNVVVHKPGWIRLDFGVERAAWVELQTEGLSDASTIYASVGESDSPAPRPLPQRFTSFQPAGTYRLEVNDELYEGVRFVWLCVGAPCSAQLGSRQPPAASHPQHQPFSIVGLRLVAQAHPTNYTGVYRPSDQVLERLWYTGAYGVRLNMLGSRFGSVLYERGDRYAFQGDGHVTLAVATAAFASPATLELILSELLSTDSSKCAQYGCKGPPAGPMILGEAYGAYPLHWVNSLCDFFWASGDRAGFLRNAEGAAAILDEQSRALEGAVAGTPWSWLRPPKIGFIGWDDRLGQGGDRLGVGDTLEGRIIWQALLLRATNEFARCLALVGDARAGAHAARARWMRKQLRSRSAGDWIHGGGRGGDDASSRRRHAHASGQAVPSGRWHSHFGMHAIAHAADAGALEEHEVAELVAPHFGNRATVCSFSPFNTYFLLRGLAAMGEVELGLDVAKHCWEPMTRVCCGCFCECCPVSGCS